MEYIKYNSFKEGYTRDLFPDVIIARCMFQECGWIIVQKNKARKISLHKPFHHKKPHYHLSLVDKWGCHRTVSLAVAIWLFYKDQDIPAGYVIDHIDENPLNNSIGNLQCIKHGENISKGHKARRAAKCQ